jgi:hypothetical protein
MGAKLNDDDINARVRRRAMALQAYGAERQAGPSQLRVLQELAGGPLAPQALCAALTIDGCKLGEALAGLSVRGHVEQLKDGRWRLKPKPARAP